MSDAAGDFSDQLGIGQARGSRERQSTDYSDTPVVVEVLPNEVVSDTRNGWLVVAGGLLLLSESQADLLVRQGRVVIVGSVTPSVSPIVVTEERRTDVHRLLDLLSSSLDWGSGFLDDEDVAAWNRVADMVGYPAQAVKTEHAPGAHFTFALRPLVRCESRLDTSAPGDGGVLTAVTLHCHLHEGHRGKHEALDPFAKWWD